MKVRTIKKITLSVIAALLVAVLAVTLAIFFGRPLDVRADEDLYEASYIGTNGELPDVDGGHRTADAERAYMEGKHSLSSGGALLAIQSGEQLFNFLNGVGAEAEYGHAYLTQDVGIAYSNASSELIYDYKTAQTNSKSIFTKVFDGNGYKVSIFGGTDDYSTTFAETSDSYNSIGNLSYRNHGFLVAVNRGTIENLTVDYNSAHGRVSILTADDHGQNFERDDMISGSGLFSDANINATMVAGIVAGQNGDGGVIDNVRLNVKGNFKVVDRQGNSGNYVYNSALVGGIAGRITDGSLISNVQVDIASGTGIFGAAQGRTVAGLTNQGACLVATGGIVGKIDKGSGFVDGVLRDGKVEYCAVTGNGEVKATVGRANRDKKYRYAAYSGAAVGACVDVTGATEGLCDGGENSGVKHFINDGQIRGIISSWQGTIQNNNLNENRTVSGQLFGSIGSNVESCAVLYDLISYRQKNDGQVLSETLDSSRSKAVKNWVAAYPTTLGGTMSVRYERSANFDIRVQILSDGYDLSDEDLEKVDMSGITSGMKKYYLDQNTAGSVIWRATFDTRTGGLTDHINFDVERPMYAEILMLNSQDTGAYTYSFGNMITLSYKDTNGEDNILFRPYRGVGEGTQLQLPEVVVTSGVQGSQPYTADNWKIYRNGVLTSIENTNLPGDYTMRVGVDTDMMTYGYYNEDERIIAWQPAQDYKFKITKGELRYGAQTTTSKEWIRDFIFELTMDRAEDFDIIKYQRNGSFVENGDPLEFFEKEFRREGTGAILDTKSLWDQGIRDNNWGTGKNGMAYSFAAYKYDNSAQKYILVAETSESITLKVDREGPELSEITYYYLDSNNDKHELEEEDLKEWRKEKVIAEFDVTDNNKSGIYTATTITGVTQNKETDTGYHITVTLSTAEPIDLVYVDRCTNETSIRLQANVDAVNPSLNYSGMFYSEGSIGYSTKGATIQYQPFFGSSDWYLQYSYEKDAQGNDIWHTREGKMVGSGSLRSFTVNWNMGSINPRKPADFKMRMVNDAGLYEPVYMTGTKENGTAISGGLVGSFVISYKYADIYIDNMLGAMIISDGEFAGKSVEELLASGNSQALENYFNKTYDSTDGYVGKTVFEIDLTVNNLSAPHEEGSTEKYNVGVLYTAAYVLKPQPFTPTKAKVVLKYDDSSAGNRKLLITAYLEGQEADRYNIYFADNSKIDFDDIYTTVPDDQSFEVCDRISARIEPKYYTIDLKDNKTFKSTYEYGDDIPSEIEVAIPDTQDTVRVQLSTEARKGQPVGNNYGVTGTVVTDLGGNMNLSVSAGTIAIVPKPVAIDVRFNDSPDIPTSVTAGTTPKFTAFYTDLSGNRQSASIKVKLGDKELTELFIRELGLYEIIVSIPDPNYTVKDGYLVGNEYVQDGTFRFYFTVSQGTLNLRMGINSAEYTGAGVNYNPGVPDGYGDFFDPNKQLAYTYYPYLSGAEYDAASGVIKGQYSREPMEGKPVAIGYYHVEVKFAGNAAFIAETYEGDFIVTKASTVLSVDRELSYSYLETKYRTFDLKEAQTQVRTVNSVDGARQLLWTSANDDHMANDLVKVYYYDSDTSSYVEVPDNSLGKGWYRDIGSYSFKIVYSGNEFYQSCELTVSLTITPAELVGITLKGGTAVYDGKNHGDVFVVTNPYSDAKIEYTCLAKKYNSIKEIEFINARTYVLFMSVKKDGYADLTLTANLEIKAAEMTGVSAKPLVATYDGNRHDVEFNGLIKRENGDYYYNNSKVTWKVNGGNEVGNIYAVNAGKYSGEVTLSAANYNDIKLNTYLEIAPKEIQVTSVRNILPAKVPSGIDMSQYRAAYTLPSGEEIGCYLAYFNENGEEVKLAEDGTLADGKYTVRLFVDNNHFIDREWKVTVGRINSAELSAMGIVAVVGVTLIMIAAIVTSVVVVKKRKENETAL